MNIDIGIVGYGVIGKTTHQVLLQNCQVKIHDVAAESSLTDVYDCDLVFICTPTANTDDIAAVRQMVQQLIQHRPSIEVVIRSTVTPGFFEALPGNLTYFPEFLRERLALQDAESTDVMYYATTAQPSLLKQFDAFNQKLKQMNFGELEILKLMTNNYRAMKVVFANHYYDLCQAHGADYNSLLTAFSTVKNGQSYMEVREDLRGYGGKCLPKDIAFAVDIFDNSSLFKAIQQDNTKWITTIRKDQ